MRLDAGPDPAPDFGLARDEFDAHLSATSAAPLAVAYSGGGDSLALLLAARAWAQARGRRLIVLHVDHELQAPSGGWAVHCQGIAQDLGLAFQRLSWTGLKPATGLPAAARAARHRLLAEAARTLGAAVVLMGHTADDVLEAQQMRREGATTPDPRLWAPSPVWPEGRGVFIFRPLLFSRRSELRAALARQGLAWIEDPANGDSAYARARARAALGANAPPPPPQPLAALDHGLTGLAQQARHGPCGSISWRQEDLGDAPAQALVQVLSIACLCAAGGGRPPRRASVERLAREVMAGRPFTATLAGARLESGAGEVVVLREAGEAARGGLAETPLSPGERQVWDGRFEIETHAPGMRVAPLAGRMGQLDLVERQNLAALSPAARKALPVLVSADGQVTLTFPGVFVRSLVQGRFEAATGQISREPEAQTETPPGSVAGLDQSLGHHQVAL